MRNHLIHRRIFFVASIFLVFTVSLSRCAHTESDNEALRQSFEMKLTAYAALLKFFKEDVVESDVSFVSAEAPDRTQCGQQSQTHQCSLRAGRWENYQHRMKQLGILWVEHKKPADRFYFVAYHESALMNARLRGVVFSNEKPSQASTYHPQQEWWPIQDSWYSFLMKDN